MESDADGALFARPLALENSLTHSLTLVRREPCGPAAASFLVTVSYRSVCTSMTIGSLWVYTGRLYLDRRDNF